MQVLSVGSSSLWNRSRHLKRMLDIHRLCYWSSLCTGLTMRYKISTQYFVCCTFWQLEYSACVFPVNFVDFLHTFCEMYSWSRRSRLLRFLGPMHRCRLPAWTMSMIHWDRTIMSLTQRNAEKRKGANVMRTTAKIGNVMLQWPQRRRSIM